MTDDSNLKSGSKGLTRRFTLLAGVGLAAAATFQEAARNMATAQDTSAFYPPVTPGLEPRGAKVQPYPAGVDPQPPFGRRQPSQIIDFKGNKLAGTQSGGVEYAVATIDIDALRRQRTSVGGSNLLTHLQMPLHRNMYSAADFAPVNAHLDAPLVSTDEHSAAQRETVSRLVEAGILVPPGIG